MTRKKTFLLHTAFPPPNPLHKLFNRQTVKLSYRCMPNMAQKISRHNAKVLKDCQPSNQWVTAVTMGKSTAQFKESATDKETSLGKTEMYYGLSSRTLKQRHNEHLNDSKKPDNRIKTKPSSHIWNLKTVIMEAVREGCNLETS